MANATFCATAFITSDLLVLTFQLLTSKAYRYCVTLTLTKSEVRGLSFIYYSAFAKFRICVSCG